MSQGKIDAFAPVSKLFLVVEDTESSRVLKNGLALWNRCPEIQRLLEGDLDAAARRKKKMRLEEKEWQASQTPDLMSGLAAWHNEIEADALQLQEGRPRMDAETVYIFMMMRGLHGSVSDREAVERLLDSVTLRVYLENRGVARPGVTTVVENVNAVSNETREFILDAQLGEILEEELDDFAKVTLDSTQAEANSAWPTDAGILYGTLRRAYHYLEKLPRLGLPRLKPWWCPEWLKEMKSLVFNINTAKKPGTRRKLYRRLFSRGEKVEDYLRGEYEQKLLPAKNQLSLSPRLRERLETIWERIGTDLENARRVQRYAWERIMKRKSTPSSEKVLSLSDPDAAYLKKGDRDGVIGYKPQLARSRNGFVCALRLSAGNTADAPELLPLVQEVQERTSVLPGLVTADDGYTSSAGRLALLSLGVKDVVLCGSKGKTITPVEEWESEIGVRSRKDRSAVESLMFTLKFVHDFGCLRRRGLEPVRAEMLEKVIAYNFRRMSQVREQKAELERDKRDKKIA
jgi:hypothetical protein